MRYITYVHAHSGPFRFETRGILCACLAPSLHHDVDDSSNTIWNTPKCVCCTEFFFLCLNKKWFAWIDAISCRCNQSIHVCMKSALHSDSNIDQPSTVLLYSKMCLHILTPTHTHHSPDKVLEPAAHRLHSTADTHCSYALAWEWYIFHLDFSFLIQNLVRTKENSSNHTYSFVDHWKCEHEINSILRFYFSSLCSYCFCEYCTLNLFFLLLFSFLLLFVLICFPICFVQYMM